MYLPNTSLSLFFHLPIFYQHGGRQRGQVLGRYQLQHQGMGLRVEAPGLSGEQARLGSIAEEVRKELVVTWHGVVDVLIPECCCVAIHFH